MERPAERVRRGREVGLAAQMEGRAGAKGRGFVGGGARGAFLPQTEPSGPVGMCLWPRDSISIHDAPRPPYLQWLKEEDEEGG